jgi:hypothetical protein
MWYLPAKVLPPASDTGMSIVNHCKGLSINRSDPPVEPLEQV